MYEVRLFGSAKPLPRFYKFSPVGAHPPTIHFLAKENVCYVMKNAKHILTISLSLLKPNIFNEFRLFTKSKSRNLIREIVNFTPLPWILVDFVTVGYMSCHW